MSEDILNELVMAAHTHALTLMGEPLIDGIYDDDELAEWLDAAGADDKALLVTSYLKETC